VLFRLSVVFFFLLGSFFVYGHEHRNRGNLTKEKRTPASTEDSTEHKLTEDVRNLVDSGLLLENKNVIRLHIQQKIRRSIS